MATFTYIPDFPIATDVEPRLRIARFGDGYSQRTRDGLNTFLRRVRPEFRARLQAEIDGIETFLQTNCDIGFDWTPPGHAAGKWICTSWSRQRVSATYHSLSATFEQVPDP